MAPRLLRQLQQLILLQPGAEILEQPHCAPGDDVTPVIGQLLTLLASDWSITANTGL